MKNKIDTKTELQRSISVYKDGINHLITSEMKAENLYVGKIKSVQEIAEKKLKVDAEDLYHYGRQLYLNDEQTTDTELKIELLKRIEQKSGRYMKKIM